MFVSSIIRKLNYLHLVEPFIYGFVCGLATCFGGLSVYRVALSFLSGFLFYSLIYLFFSRERRRFVEGKKFWEENRVLLYEEPSRILKVIALCSMMSVPTGIALYSAWYGLWIEAVAWDLYSSVGSFLVYLRFFPILG